MPADAPKSTPICTKTKGSCVGATDRALVLVGPSAVTHPEPASNASGSESERAPRYRRPCQGGQRLQRKTAASDPGKGQTGGPGKVCQRGIDHGPTTRSIPSALSPRNRCSLTSRCSLSNFRTTQPPHGASGRADARCDGGLRWSAKRPECCPLTKYPCSETRWGR